MEKISPLLAQITNSRIWRSIFRHGWPNNALDRSLAMTSNVFFHLHPVKVKRKSLKWTYTFGLGIISAILFGVLIWTGVLLMFYYVPSVDNAYNSMKEIQLSVPLGQFTRNMHRWSAHGMVLMVILHISWAKCFNSLLHLAYCCHTAADWDICLDPYLACSQGWRISN
jgi:hypothetical protein